MENEQMVLKSQVNGEEEERKRDKEQHSRIEVSLQNRKRMKRNQIINDLDE